MNVVFFTDRDLGKRFPSILSSAGLLVERHQDHFAPDAPDEVWLEAIGGRGWVGVTHDQRIRYKPNERDAVIRHRLSLLVVIGKAPLPELAVSFVAAAPRIIMFLSSQTAPFIAKVYRTSSVDKSANAGRVELWYPRPR